MPLLQVNPCERSGFSRFVLYSGTASSLAYERIIAFNEPGHKLVTQQTFDQFLDLVFSDFRGTFEDEIALESRLTTDFPSETFFYINAGLADPAIPGKDRKELAREFAKKTLPASSTDAFIPIKLPDGYKGGATWFAPSENDVGLDQYEVTPIGYSEFDLEQPLEGLCWAVLEDFDTFNGIPFQESRRIHSVGELLAHRAREMPAISILPSHNVQGWIRLPASNPAYPASHYAFLKEGEVITEFSRHFAISEKDLPEDPTRDPDFLHAIIPIRNPRIAEGSYSTWAFSAQYGEDKMLWREMNRQPAGIDAISRRELVFGINSFIAFDEIDYSRFDEIDGKESLDADLADDLNHPWGDAPSI